MNEGLNSGLNGSLDGKKVQLPTKAKRKYTIKNPHPRKTHQVNVILDDNDFAYLQLYRDQLMPGAKLASALRNMLKEIHLIEWTNKLPLRLLNK